jgi:hypothetical protein
MFCATNAVTAAVAQLAAPGALDRFTECTHHTCTWVPDDSSPSFNKGGLNYFVHLYGKDGSQGEFVLRRGTKELLRTQLKDLSASVSVVWADDERHFAVTWSDGGSIGDFHVRVFLVTGDSVSELPTIQKAWAAFKQRHWCKTRGDNIQAYAWLPGSQQLILVLSVYPTGDCGIQMGHTEAYMVDAMTGAIQQNWDLKKLNAYMRAHPE